MNLFGKPVLKFRTKQRLHIAKEPAIVSWATVVALSSVAFTVNYFLIPDYFGIPAVFFILCLLLTLNLIQTWDFIMDKEENLVTLVTRSWYHGLSMKIPEENVKRFPLNYIKSVVINSDHGIDLIKEDRSCMTIKSEGQDMRSLRKLKEEIATFLHLERIEYLKGKDKMFYKFDVDPWNVDWPENQDRDEDENLDLEEQEYNYEYGRNIKVISGPL